MLQGRSGPGGLPLLAKLAQCSNLGCHDGEFGLGLGDVEFAFGVAQGAVAVLPTGLFQQGLGLAQILAVTVIAYGVSDAYDARGPAFALGLAAFKLLAQEAGCTPAQLALAWLLQKAPHIIPIPGTTSVEHLKENLAADSVKLSPDIVAKAEALINQQTVAGHRYAPQARTEVDTEEF